MSTGMINLTWARALLEELVCAGVCHVCVSPGSRSTPLALAVAERLDVSTSVHVDERSGAFFALGCARATGAPAVFVCTSGTAAANVLPAVVEAHYSCVPLVVLTADRPAELRDTGAWQTIDQLRLFGAYARWFVDVATPSGEPEMLRYVRNVAARAVAVARARPSGPVHLNLPFREPLAPTGDEVRAQPAEDDGTGTARPAASIASPHGGADHLALAPSLTLAPDDVVDDLARRIASEPRGLLLAGRIEAGPRYADAVARLARAAGYPILAEAGGGLRFGRHDRSLVITAYDALFRSDAWSALHRPGLVLRLGASFTWRSVARFLEQAQGAPQIVVDPELTWDDPTRLARLRLAVDPTALCEALAARLAEVMHAMEEVHDPAAGRVASGDAARGRTAWPAAWRTAEERASAVRARCVAEGAESGVGWVYGALADALPDGAILYAANSMAVRDLDSFAPASERRVRVLANRGAAGIDGTISSALGAANASGAPTVLVTGDLAFAHDLNGLAAARLPGIDLTIVVVDDDGGGIFEHLPVANLDPEVFRRFFVAPSGVNVAAACAAYGVPHRSVRDAYDLASAIARPPGTGPGVEVLHVSVDRAANTAWHRRYWAEVRAAIAV